jgi:hypothetical protein
MKNNKKRKTLIKVCRWKVLPQLGIQATKTIIFVLLFASSSFFAFAQCNPHKIIKSFKPNLIPFKYDSYSFNEITFTDKPQEVEVEFSAFSGMKYKLVFGTSMFDESIKVNIYDKSKFIHKRTKLYDNSNGVDNMFWSTELDKPGIYYIDYEIPAKGTSQSDNGCVVILIGFMENAAKF